LGSIKFREYLDKLLTRCEACGGIEGRHVRRNMKGYMRKCKAIQLAVRPVRLSVDDLPVLVLRCAAHIAVLLCLRDFVLGLSLSLPDKPFLGMLT
jgi:hypothetical protein